MASIDLYLMSPPGPRWALTGRANFRSADAPAVDPALALVEWLALADAIEARGGRVIALVPPDDTPLTGLPYAAECGQVVSVPGRRPRFLLPNMKPVHRRGERVLWKGAAEAMGFDTVRIQGTWEAQGDVAFFGGRLLLFFGGRTTREGAEDAAAHFAPREGSLGDPLFVEISEPAFHGNMAVLPLPRADRMLVCPDVLLGDSLATLERAFGARRLCRVSVDEVRAYGTNGLPIGEDVLIPHVTPPRVALLLASLGLTPVVLPMVELCEKAGGASRCLVSHAAVDADALQLPRALDYRSRRAELTMRLPEQLRARLHVDAVSHVAKT